jgi:hypothetical protein
VFFKTIVRGGGWGFNRFSLFRVKRRSWEMAVIIYLPQIVMIIGLILYVATDGKASECGRIMFWSGLFVTLFQGFKT